MDKRDRSSLFRKRLEIAMAQAGLSRSGLSRATGVDRSTVGQVLNTETSRLPNAQLVADLAGVLGISTDWLLGLTDRPERPGDIVAAAMALSPAERSSADAQLLDWHREAAGYKVRHVPATLPDILKTDAMLSWEYGDTASVGAGAATTSLREQLAWLKSGISDYEIALPLHEVHACREGTGYYAGLPEKVRTEQLAALAAYADTMYPRLRIVLFDARTVFSAPVTVFGPMLAVIYVGRFYLAFRTAERVRSLADHFDWLVRHAKVDARDVPAFLTG